MIGIGGTFGAAVLDDPFKGTAEILLSRGLLAFEIFADLVVAGSALLAIWLFERWFDVLEGRESPVLLGFIPLQYPFDAAHIAVISRLVYRSWKDIRR